MNGSEYFHASVKNTNVECECAAAKNILALSYSYDVMMTSTILRSRLKTTTDFFFREFSFSTNFYSFHIKNGQPQVGLESCFSRFWVQLQNFWSEKSDWTAIIWSYHHVGLQISPEPRTTKIVENVLWTAFLRWTSPSTAFFVLLPRSLTFCKHYRIDCYHLTLTYQNFKRDQILFELKRLVIN
jgi:hypothetical protein